MTVSAVVDIVHGELLNTPTINRVESIRIDARKVKRGDLFLSLFGNDTQTAIDNGAYAVIVPKSTQALDNETAWIGVEDVNRSLLLLLRLLLVEKSIEFYFLEEPLFSVASGMLSKNRSVLLLEGSIANHVEALLDREELRYCFSANKELLNMLSSSVLPLPSSHCEGDVLVDSLFVSRLYCAGERYLFTAASRLKEPLTQLLSFCKERSLQFEADLSQREGIFTARYLTAELKLSAKPSSKVLIVDSFFSPHYVTESISFLKERFRWARLLFCSEEKIGGCEHFESAAALAARLKTADFDIVYVVSRAPDAIYSALEQAVAPRDDLTLF